MPEETDSDKINTPAAFDGAEAIAAIIPAGPPPPAAEHEAYRDSGSQTGGNSNPDETNRPATKQPPRDGVSAPIAVVGIGASAGGVPVLQELFGKMSAETGLSFVVVMHLSPEHESNLAEILQRVTAMGVTQVTEETKVQPNCIYVIPPDKVLTMRDSMIIVSEGQRSEGRRVAIDLFFRTLAEQYGQRCACIILSGTDSDGVIGLKHIKAQGGVTIAQEPTEAEHSSMPRSAIDTGMVDWVLPVDQMPERLAQYARNELAMTLPAERDDSLATLPDLGPRGAGGPLISKRSDASEDESALHRVLVFLRSQTGHDFTHYKRATVLRRIARRLQVNQLESIPQYLEFLRTHPAEPRALLNDLLIGVTHFFRDQSAWATMEAHVPQLFAAKTSADQVRVWAPGCATGEEAYSIAILLLEHSFRLENPPQIQVFATDLDEDSVRFAREGIYPRTIEADVSEQRLRRFFFQQHGRYRIRKEVRELVLFADHDILRDSPFSKLDLVTCRNLLIYLKPDAQHRVIDVFHFALRAGGLLFLGGSENLDDNHSLFSPLDRKHRIFVRRAVPRMPIVNLAPFATRPAPVTPRLASRQVAKEFTPPEEQEKAPAEVAQGGGGTVRFESLGELHLKLLEATAPPSVIVDSNPDILHMSPNATAYLHFSAGEPSANVLKLVDDSLRPELRTALFRAGQSGANVSLKNIAVQHEGGTRAVNVQVRPAALSGDLLGRSDGEAEKFFLIIFEDAGVAVPQTGEHVEQPHEEVTVHLENEIRQLRSQLNATVQQYEASTEELKASNEELQAMNEELRSATEELETSREELQSINEELTTVNAELKSNLDELSRANSDLQNLMASTDIGTIFLDRKLRVKRFTPRVQDLFNLIPGDIGRPLSDITNKINYPELMQHARHVLATLEKHSSEIQANGNWFVVRMAPYRSLDERIEGVVISFIDVTARREAEEALRESEEQFRRAIEDAPIPIIMHAEDGQVLQISRTWTELTGYSAEEMQSFDAWLNNAYGEGANALRAHMQELFKGGTRVTNIEFPIKTRGGEMRHWSFSASAPGTLRDGRRFIVGMALDITGRQESEQQLRESEQQLRESEQFVRSTLDSFSSMIAILDRNGVILDVNQSWKDFALENGYDSPNYGIGENYLKVTRRAADKGTLDAQRIGDGIEAILNGTSRAFEFEYPCHSPTAFRWFIVNVSPLSTAGGGAVIWHTDITARKQTEEALRESEGRFRQFAENSADVFWILDAKTRKVEYINPIYEKMFGQPRDRVMADRQKRLDVVVAEDREKASSGLQEALAGGTFVRNYRIQRASDGEQRWIRDTGFPIRNDGGEITRIAGVAQDVTGDKEQTAALNVTKERFELLVEEAKEYAMFLLDPSNVITYWSTGAERVFGWSAAEAVGQSGELIFTPEDRAREEEEKEIDVALRNGTAPDQRWHMRKDGTRIWVDGVMRRLDDEKTGALRGFAKIARDATSQREGEEQLRRAHEELERRVQERTAELQGANAKLHQAMEQRQMLEKQILRITEEERARISQDLHDSLCQELTATAFLLKSRAKAIAAQSRVAADSLTEAAETVNANAGLARDLARGFHPMELGASGLPSALRELCSHTNDHISCRCDCPRSLRLDENVAVNLYRIAQEAVTNSIKHAKANEIVISLERTNGELVLTVSDDGEGKRRRGRGLGTHIMQYRARAVGGTLRVESARGRGTSVTCRVPLRRTKT